MKINSKRIKSNLVIFLGILSVLSVITVPSAQSAGLSPSFPTTPSDGNLSITDSVSKDPQIATFGSNVFVVWEEDTDDQIRFAKSSDGGSNFSPSSEIGSATSISGALPKISASNDDVYTVWVDDDGGKDKIKFILGDNNGTDFSSGVITLSSNTSSLPEVSSSTTNDVYVTWLETSSNDVMLSSSNNGGSTWNDPMDVGNSSASSTSPQVATSSDGTNVYVVWAEDEFGGNIKIARSTNSGTSFSSPTTPSDGTLGSTVKWSDPKIAVSGDNVYVIWQDNREIKLSASTDGGDTFSAPVVAGNPNSSTRSNAQVAADANNVYVTWTETRFSDKDILISRSTDSGTSFISPSVPANFNLSDGPNDQIKPQISVSGDNVFVVWEEINNNISVIASNDKADTFGSKINLSDTDGFSSINPSVSSIGDTSHIVWADFSPGNFDIFTKSAPISPVTVEFDKSNYKLSDTATIAITDLSLIGNGTLGPVTITSSTGDPVGISISFDEDDGSPGTFHNSITFTEDSLSDQSTKLLKANPGDSIKALYDSNQGSTGIFSRDIFINQNITESNPIHLENICSENIFKVLVDDMNSNLDDAKQETITVNLSSGADPVGIPLVLTETEIDSGIFGGDESSPLPQFGLYTVEGLIPVNSIATISEIGEPNTEGLEGPIYSNPNNEDPNRIENATVTVTSTTSESGIQLYLFEESADSHIFSGQITFSSLDETDEENKILHVQAGDFISITGSSGLVEHGLITPNPLNLGALQIINPQLNLDSDDPDDVTLTYKLSSKSSEARIECSGAGGGGGGLVRPSLVVNALAGIGGGGSAYSSPTLQLSNLVQLGQIDVPLEVEQMILNHDSNTPTPAMELNYFEDFDYPLTINDKGFVLSGYSTTLETQTLETNMPHSFKFLFYESDKIQHFSLYTNLRDANTAIHQSDTQILYNDGQEIQVIDPNGFFENVILTVNEKDDLKKEVVLEITFANTMETTDIIIRSWDPFLNSFDTHILDAITVVTDEIIESPITTYEEPIIEELQSQTIPIWIKNNAAWWSEQQIGDSDFVAGIEYLIKNGIIDVPGVKVTNSDSTEIPDWIKNNAGWWAESLITDDDFIQAMQWLVANGVIQI
jgi:hypothetical protein